ncbi:hypothetical protein BDQ17DRAFT_961697 [Cyathus striatus]|nr:hypothetical protein BDQ17DRAFT_961697 [Cyathus striatus]
MCIQKLFLRLSTSCISPLFLPHQVYSKTSNVGLLNNQYVALYIILASHLNRIKSSDFTILKSLKNAKKIRWKQDLNLRGETPSDI